jgi:nitrilase
LAARAVNIGWRRNGFRAAAKRNKMFVALGLSERDGGSLYIAQWIIGPDGETVAKRRKLKPTHAERTVFGEGDGSHLAVHDLDVGRLAFSLNIENVA